MKNKDLRKLLALLGFKSLDGFKTYLKSKAKLNEYGAVCYTEKRKGYELTYSNNCNSPWMIGTNIKGSFNCLYIK